MHGVLVGERLADYDVIAVRKRTQNRFAILGRGQKAQAAVLSDNIDNPGAESGALALVAELEGVKDVDRFYAADSGHQLGRFWKQRRELACAGPPGGPAIQVRAQLLIQPDDNRFL